MPPFFCDNNIFIRYYAKYPPHKTSFETPPVLGRLFLRLTDLYAEQGKTAAVPIIPRHFYMRSEYDTARI